MMNNRRVLYLTILAMSLFNLTVSSTANCPVEGRRIYFYLKQN